MKPRSESIRSHFEALTLWHWTEVADEARQMWDVLFDDELSGDGEVMALIDGACSRSYYGAIEAVAGAIGATPDDLSKAVALWSEQQIRLRSENLEGR